MTTINQKYPFFLRPRTYRDLARPLPGSAAPTGDIDGRDRQPVLACRSAVADERRSGQEVRPEHAKGLGGLSLGDKR